MCMRQYPLLGRRAVAIGRQTARTGLQCVHQITSRTGTRHVPARVDGTGSRHLLQHRPWAQGAVEGGSTMYKFALVVAAATLAAGTLAAPATAHADNLLLHRVQQEKGDRKSTRLNSSHVAISYAV